MLEIFKIIKAQIRQAHFYWYWSSTPIAGPFCGKYQRADLKDAMMNFSRLYSIVYTTFLYHSVSHKESNQFV